MNTSTLRRQIVAQRNVAAADKMATELCGVVDAVVWISPDGDGMTIAKLRGGASSGITVKGQCDGAGLDIGMSYRFLGRWVNTLKYGDQFEFSTHILDTPLDRDGIVRYLQQVARNVGFMTAEKLFLRYGDAAVATLRTDPMRVVSDRIMREDEAREASEDLVANASAERTRIDLFGLFAGRGFSSKVIPKCIEKWGANAAARIKRDALTLLVHEMPGAGWRRCDKMYLDLGGNPNRLKRQMLAAWEVMRCDNDGHTWMGKNTVTSAVYAAVGHAAARTDDAVKLGLRAKWFAARKDTDGRELLAESEKAQAERDLAAFLLARMSGDGVRFNDVGNCWPDITRIYNAQLGGMMLSEHQVRKIVPILRQPVAILGGPPGTGKTFTAAKMIQAWVAMHGRARIAVCAPTGKAAVRITAAMGRYGVDIKATTIHRLLGIGRNGHDGKGWGFLANENSPLDYDVIVCDEFSMTDTSLAASLVRATARGTLLLFVGDVNQLAPVGHGAPLRDMILAGVPYAELTEIERQGKRANSIVRACTAIKAALPWETDDVYDEAAGKNLRLFETETEAESVAVLRRVLAQFAASKRFDPVWQTQVLVATNEKSEISRVALNELLHPLLNPVKEDETAEIPFRVNDKVICLRNCWVERVKLGENAWNHVSKPADRVKSYIAIAGDEAGGEHAGNGTMKVPPTFVANGETGRVVAVDVATGKQMVVAFGEPSRMVRVGVSKKARAHEENPGVRPAGVSDGGDKVGAYGDFALAYAITTHKFQGSELPCVIVLIDQAAGFVACREWYYTAISRASKLCILIGKRSVMARQLLKVNIAKRKTMLVEMLKTDDPVAADSETESPEGETITHAGETQGVVGETIDRSIDPATITLESDL